MDIVEQHFILFITKAIISKILYLFIESTSGLPESNYGTVNITA